MKHAIKKGKRGHGIRHSKQFEFAVYSTLLIYTAHGPKKQWINVIASCRPVLNIARARTHARTHARARLHMHARTHARTHTSTRARARVRAPTQTHRHTDTQTHRHTHTHTHTHTLQLPREDANRSSTTDESRVQLMSLEWV